MIKYKYIIIIAALGIIANTLGAFIKILHWEFPLFGMAIGGSNILALGTMFWIAAAILLIFKAVFAKDSDFLNK
ncbi:hypothetical protein [Nonlabens ulvanivorans]|uniref:hypothetical protein n=1 Tax=Nonlabens ulvanivorans TaxID=906888 RepID=UPI00294338BF|nr:hypothetical protein [Nonlabens ulvanivorans]WOI23382.1 hypothetical protein R1T42_02795 [Nonlabens ulvanivorans]